MSIGDIWVAFTETQRAGKRADQSRDGEVNLGSTRFEMSEVTRGYVK